MAKYTIRQGNSLWLQLTGDTDSIDTTWANWTGKWAIRDKTTKAVLASGDLTRSDVAGVFILAVPPVSTAALSAAEYDLITEISNVARNYVDEWKPDTLIIQAQGIIPTP